MLDRLKPKPGSRRPRKRVGRGIGSGHGKTCGRGQKGAGARSGRETGPGFEGGQQPLIRRLPKRGFHNPFGTRYRIVHVGDLARRFAEGAEVGPEELRAARLVRRAGPIKLLSDGEIGFALVVRVHAASEAARRKIEAAGGRVELLAPSPKRAGGAAP